MPNTEKVKRSAFATFMNVTPGEGAPTWKRLGKGVTSLSVAYNPNVTSEQYIDEDNASSSVDSYAASIDGSQTAYSGDPCFDFIDGLRRKRAIGSELDTDLLMVYMYAPVDGSENKFEAEKCRCNIQFGDFGGEAGGSVVINYTIGLIGDPEIGTVTVAGGVPTFTKNT